MKDFVISDIHGCYLTAMHLIHHYYDSSTMRLVLLGDYLDKGRYVYEMWQWIKKLSPNPKHIILRGNHEQELIEYYLANDITPWYEFGGKKTIEALLAHQVDLKEVVELFSQMPLSYETPGVFYSHAGVSIFPHNPLDPNDSCGLLWNRMTVQNLGKLQIFGHTPHLTGPIYQGFTNSYTIDTGVFLNGWLSALVVDEVGQVIEIYREKTDPQDLWRKETFI